MVVCFIGHRKISVDGSFKERLANLIKGLIDKKTLTHFCSEVEVNSMNYALKRSQN